MDRAARAPGKVRTAYARVLVQHVEQAAAGCAGARRCRHGAQCRQLRLELEHDGLESKDRRAKAGGANHIKQGRLHSNAERWEARQRQEGKTCKALSPSSCRLPCH